MDFEVTVKNVRDVFETQCISQSVSRVAKFFSPQERNAVQIGQ